MKVTVRRMGSTLRPGMLIRLTPDGQIYRVDMVNDCRARCVPVGKIRHVEIAKRFGEIGEKVSFDAADTTPINISPNSEVEILPA